MRVQLMKLLIHSIGRLSNGIEMCRTHGLTSGKTLDYVYENRPSGRFGVGRWIDRMFLESPGWEAIRIRRQNLETLLERSIGDLRRDGRAVSLLDVASGPGSYILAVLGRVGEDGITTVCRDLDSRWVEEGREKAARRGLQRVIFEEGDALDTASLEAIRPRPNAVVSSGFYDWITDDDVVRRSIELIAGVTEPGGYFVLTNQAAHPDLEMVSEVFEDFDHQPLRMKMRPPSTIEKWLVMAGFDVQETLQDEWGYYTVTQARRRPA